MDNFNNQNSQFDMNFNSQNYGYNQQGQQNYGYTNNYNNPQQPYNIKYGNGEVEYVMSMKDLLIYTLLFMIPIYNIYLMIKIIIGPTRRTNKSITNSFRFMLIMLAIMMMLGIVMIVLEVGLLAGLVATSGVGGI